MKGPGILQLECKCPACRGLFTTLTLRSSWEGLAATVQCSKCKMFFSARPDNTRVLNEEQ
jgi:hypothetical protein